MWYPHRLQSTTPANGSSGLAAPSTGTTDVQSLMVEPHRASQWSPKREPGGDSRQFGAWPRCLAVKKPWAMLHRHRLDPEVPQHSVTPCLVSGVRNTASGRETAAQHRRALCSGSPGRAKIRVPRRSRSPSVPEVPCLTFAGLASDVFHQLRLRAVSSRYSQSMTVVSVP